MYLKVWVTVRVRSVSIYTGFYDIGMNPDFIIMSGSLEGYSLEFKRDSLQNRRPTNKTFVFELLEQLQFLNGL